VRHESSPSFKLIPESGMKYQVMTVSSSTMKYYFRWHQPYENLLYFARIGIEGCLIVKFGKGGYFSDRVPVKFDFFA
jgi:hypothetical protein